MMEKEVIRVHFSDGSYKSFYISESTTTTEIINHFAEKLHYDHFPKSCFLLREKKKKKMRKMQEDENISSLVNTWKKSGYRRHDDVKYGFYFELTKEGQKKVDAGVQPVASTSAPSSSSTNSGYVPKALPQDDGSGVKIPDLGNQAGMFDTSSIVLKKGNKSAPNTSASNPPSSIPSVRPPQRATPKMPPTLQSRQKDKHAEPAIRSQSQQNFSTAQNQSQPLPQRFQAAQPSFTPPLSFTPPASWKKRPAGPQLSVPSVPPRSFVSAQIPSQENANVPKEVPKKQPPPLPRRENEYYDDNDNNSSTISTYDNNSSYDADSAYSNDGASGNSYDNNSNYNNGEIQSDGDLHLPSPDSLPLPPPSLVEETKESTPFQPEPPPSRAPSYQQHAPKEETYLPPPTSYDAPPPTSFDALPPPPPPLEYQDTQPSEHVSSNSNNSFVPPIEPRYPNKHSNSPQPSDISPRILPPVHPPTNSPPYAAPTPSTPSYGSHHPPPGVPPPRAAPTATPKRAPPAIPEVDVGLDDDEFLDFVDNIEQNGTAQNTSMATKSKTAAPEEETADFGIVDNPDTSWFDTDSINAMLTVGLEKDETKDNAEEEDDFADALDVLDSFI